MDDHESNELSFNGGNAETSDIGNIFHELTGIRPSYITLAANNSHRIFQVRTGYRDYAVKEYNICDPDISCSKYTQVHRTMCQSGFRIPDLIHISGDSCLLDCGSFKYAFYPWLNGVRISEHEAGEKELLELSDSYGRMLCALQGLSGFERARGFIWSVSDIKRRYAEVQHLKTMSAQSDIRILLSEKAAEFEAMIRNEPVDCSEMTWALTHGDYYISQVLWNKKGRIDAVLDFDSIEIKPVSWELIWCFCSAIMTDIGFDEIYMLLKRFLTTFLERYPLKEIDILQMPALYHQTLATTLYGYRALAFGDKSGMNSLLERHRLMRLMRCFRKEVMRQLADELRDMLLWS